MRGCPISYQGAPTCDCFLRPPRPQAKLEPHLVHRQLCPLVGERVHILRSTTVGGRAGFEGTWLPHIVIRVFRDAPTCDCFLRPPRPQAKLKPHLVHRQLRPLVGEQVHILRSTTVGGRPALGVGFEGNEGCVVAIYRYQGVP